MDEIQEQIESVEEETRVVKDLYDLVDKYQVPVNPEEQAVYQVLKLVFSLLLWHQSNHCSSDGMHSMSSCVK